MKCNICLAEADYICKEKVHNEQSPVNTPHMIGYCKQHYDEGIKFGWLEENEVNPVES